MQGLVPPNTKVPSHPLLSKGKCCEANFLTQDMRTVFVNLILIILQIPFASASMWRFLTQDIRTVSVTRMFHMVQIPLWQP